MNAGLNPYKDVENGSINEAGQARYLWEYFMRLKHIFESKRVSKSLLRRGMWGKCGLVEWQGVTLLLCMQVWKRSGEVVVMKGHRNSLL